MNKKISRLNKTLNTINIKGGKKGIEVHVLQILF